MSIDEKAKALAWQAFIGRWGGEEDRFNVAIEAYESAKSVQPVGCYYEVPFRRADHVEAMQGIIRRCKKTMDRTVGLPWATLDQISRIASRQLLLMKTPMQDE